MLESRGGEVLAAVKRGLAVPDAELPRFPRAPRWDRDPDFDDRVARLKAVRDAAAMRLDVDPGVLCSRDRLEMVARRNPRSVEELSEIPGLRRWQIAELGEEFVRALQSGPASSPSSASPNGARAESTAVEEPARRRPPRRSAQPSPPRAAPGDEESPYRAG